MDQDMIKNLRREAAEMLEKGNVNEAIPIIRQMAHWSDLDSQLLLVDMFAHGAYGVIPNAKAAFEYLQVAALNQDPESQYELACTFRDGKGTDKNLEKAFYFMNKAANNGVKAAYDDLSTLYLMGWGTNRDLEQAEIWNKKALVADPDNDNAKRHQSMIQNLKAKEEKARQVQ